MTELERPGLRKEKSMVVKRSCNVRCSVTEEELGVYMGAVEWASVPDPLLEERVGRGKTH